MTKPAGRRERAEALQRILASLARADYRFVTPTPGTHRLVSGRRPVARAGNLRDVFGWNRSFSPEDLPAEMFADLTTAGVLSRTREGWRTSVRVSSIEDRLHLHSAAGSGRDAVFLGPDSYRFVRLIDAVLREPHPVRRAVDVGAGAGAGALAVAARRPEAEIWATDVNAKALRYLEINAAQAGAGIRLAQGSGLSALEGDFDLILANPPYVAGKGGRTYRDGGGLHGAEMAMAWVDEALPRLTAGGRLVLYTGSPIIEGGDVVRSGLEDRLGRQFSMTYEELDPDVFGGMLAGAAYAEVERIAAVGAVVRRAGPGEPGLKAS